jgi:hypothetical protein
MSTQRVTQIVVLHNVSEMRHPTLETTVRERTKTWHIVDSVSTGSIPLFAIRAVKYHVELYPIEISKGFGRTLDDGRVQIALDIVL